ncbi:substrate-binding periplasmic protein [Inhella gelatinilytica]|uniref:Transporter substrate-binding domain-containing protein n=1 Tax=Inhella gelatinilytica TaxID=2795030 RepID=A0A931IWR3_9BURK|nr:transporter substrate-binding domain-containing protein [Inhella gelatinilytica]MBH9554242.1 transporter substrate-binding domain-containing protein [Inhella gelatinilytica]
MPFQHRFAPLTWPAKLTSGLAWVIGVTAAQGQALQIEYRDKPPYSHTEAGRPAGFLLKRTQDVLRLAGIEASFQEVPARRILSDIQSGRGPICSPGWYRLAEREKFANFTLPIHKDRPHVVLAHAAAAKAVRQHQRIAALFEDTSLVLGVMEGVSYGPTLDQALSKLTKPPVQAQISPMQLAKMVAARRADYMLIDQEDVEWLLAHEELGALGLVRLEFADMPEGLQRFLMCSKQVDSQTLERINTAIRAVAPEMAR